jgi:outer membrane protein insertion porin family
MHSIRLIPSLRRAALLGAFVGATALCLSPALGAQIPEPAPPDEPAAGAVVDSIHVEGNQWVETAAIVGTIGLPIGEPITYRDIQEAERRLWGTGRFEDIQVYVRGDGSPENPAILTFVVEERPMVRRLRIEGLEHLSAGDVRDTIRFQAGEPYSPQRMRTAQEFIRQGLAERGIPFAQIELRQVPIPDSEGEIEVVLDVTEGHRVTIAEVLFRGNENFRDSELRRAMNTRPEGFWWFRTGQYQEDSRREDLTRRLPEFYASHGFLDFVVLGDTLIVDPETGKARLEVDVEEGPQYRLAEFRVEGARRFPQAQLEEYYTAEEGGLLRSLGIGRRRAEGTPVFDRSAFLDAAGQVEQLYRNQGYLYANVEPVIERQPPAEDEEHPTVAVRWQIREGQPAYINRIHIRGNTFTHDRVIREQIVLLPGDIYSEERILRSYQSISGLGFFHTPLPFPDIQPDEETGDVDITFTVEEQQTGSVNFGTSVGGIAGVSGFVGYEQPNLFGQAKAGSLRWDFGQYQNNFELQYSDPSLFQSRISGSISLFDSRDRFFQFQTGERKRRGGLVRFGVPLPQSRFSRVHMGYSLSRTDFRLREGADDRTLFGTPPGTQSQLNVGLTRRTLDHPIFPTVGSNLSWDADLNGGFLGGDGDFNRHRLRGEWWVPVGEFGGEAPGSRPIIFSLGLKARAGTIFGDASRFPFDRFWLGGVQFGESLRGYDETTITPQGYFPRGSGQITDIERLGDTFVKLGAEYAARISNNLSFSAFYEAGNVWRSPREIDPSRLFRGAGVGIMVVTPFGPIGLDYAYGFDKAVPGWQLHFRMGGQGAMF